MICKLCNKQQEKEDPFSLCQLCGQLVMDKIAEKFDRGLIRNLPEKVDPLSIHMNIEEMFIFKCEVEITIFNIKQCKGN